jgi:DNA mismatch repair protein MutS2
LIRSETLDLLEWQRLCQHLSTFAATKLGTLAAQHLQIPNTQEDSQYLLVQTEEAYRLETTLDRGLSFDGIYDIGASLERAELQGILSPEELLRLATTLAGARQLRRTIDNQHEEFSVLEALVAQLMNALELAIAPVPSWQIFDIRSLKFAIAFIEPCNSSCNANPMRCKTNRFHNGAIGL